MRCKWHHRDFYLHTNYVLVSLCLPLYITLCILVLQAISMHVQIKLRSVLKVRVFRTHFTKEHTLDRKETNTFFLQITFSIRCVEKLFALKCSLKWTTPAASLSSNVIFIRFYLLVEMRSLQVPNVSPVNLWLHFCPKSKDFSAPLPRVLDLK